MALNPVQFANALREAIKDVDGVETVATTHITNLGHAVIDVRDEDGGVLRITINQFRRAPA